MSSLLISLISTACILTGVLLGWRLQTLLPGHHLSKESQDTIKLGAGIVATMSGMVLGLLVSSSKSSFDSVNTMIAQSGAKIVLLDHVLASYGPETKELRAGLRKSLAERIDQIWSKHKDGPSGLAAVESGTAMSRFRNALHALSPKDEAQKSSLTEAGRITDEMAQNRLMIFEEQQQSLPPVLLVVLVVWLSLLFLSFGLFSPRNVTVFTVMFVCAIAVSAALFLILEMGRPLDGLVRASSAPLSKALELLQRPGSE